MPRPRPVRYPFAVSLLLPALVIFSACGGNVDGGVDPTESGGTGAGATTGTGATGISGTPGSGTPGNGAAPGSGGALGRGGLFGKGGAPGKAGSPGSGGANFGQGGASVAGGGSCCLAFPICKAGDKELMNNSCPAGAECYQVSKCCSVITCMRPTQCDAVPTCDAGDSQILGQCPPDASCYSRSLCGTTIQCLHPSGEGGAGGVSGEGCHPAEEHHRRYATTSPQQCTLVDYVCSPNTAHFYNACGCGCEQDASCPEWVDCMPGPIVNSLCSPEGAARCPFTQRAY